jgi:hypothetical protein
MTYKAYVLGDPKPIPDEDVKYLREKSSDDDASIRSAWRYYCRLANDMG